MALAVNRPGVIFKKCDLSNHKPDTNKNCAAGTCQHTCDKPDATSQMRQPDTCAPARDAALPGQRRAGHLTAPSWDAVRGDEGPAAQCGRSWRLPTANGSSLTGKGPRARVIRPEVVTLDQPDELGGPGLGERSAIRVAHRCAQGARPNRCRL